MYDEPDDYSFNWFVTESDYDVHNSTLWKKTLAWKISNECDYNSYTNYT